MHRRRKNIATHFRGLLGAAILLAGSHTHAQEQPRKIPTSVDELLWWLPGDTETIQVTQTVKGARGPLFAAMGATRGEIEFGDVAYAEPLQRHLRSATLKATIQGARRFRPASGLGATPHDGAIVFLFAAPLGPAGTALFQELTKSAAAVHQSGAVRVLEFRDEIESDVWVSLIAMPADNVLVVATDRVYLDELLARRHAGGAARALPQDLPEWKVVDTRAAYWAVRHYAREPREDTTSPFTKGRDGAAFDPDAIGVTVHASADGATLVAHYLSAANGERTARRMWDRPGDGVAPAFRSAGPNAIEARFAARDEEQLSIVLFYLLASLGHAIYL
jgi:hypothetical protein